ncbi:hypothetical protein LLEC1_02455, partial [Akanthomyces lecanii]
VPPANVTIRRGTSADASAISQAHYEALDRFHEFYGAFLERHPRELVPAMTARAFAKREPAQVFYVAEEDGGDVVGFVRYCVEEAKAGGEEKKEKGEEEESPYACKEAMKEVWKAFSDAQAKRDAMVEMAAKDQRHMCKPPTSTLFFRCLAIRSGNAFTGRERKKKRRIANSVAQQPTGIQHLMIRPSHQLGRPVQEARVRLAGQLPHRQRALGARGGAGAAWAGERDAGGAVRWRV